MTAVYLMTWTLVLATRLRWFEQWFGGLDRMYFWHKQYALWSTALLVPHILLTGRGRTLTTVHEVSSTAQTGRLLGAVSALGLLALVAISLPRVSRILRLPHERWLLLHRFIGLLVFIALIHGLSLDRIIGGSNILKIIHIIIGARGMAAYGYDELVMRHRSPDSRTSPLLMPESCGASPCI